jgi:undecaprenyl-diphosphatase
MIEDLLKAAILGIVQGLTEFLPVSSTGHLILAEKALGVDEDRYGLSFDAALHMGTLLALLWFFGGRWTSLAAGGLRGLRDRSLADAEGRLAWLIVLGTIPAAALGFAFEDQIEDAFRSPLLVATMLIAFSPVFLLAEALGSRRRVLGDLTFVDALVVGFAQAVALVPGVSRSGATISAGLLRGVNRRESATFAFLLSAPILAGAGAARMADVAREFADGALGRDEFVFFAVGFVFAATVGYASIRFLLRFLATNSLLSFAAYRVALGLLVYAVLAVRATT